MKIQYCPEFDIGTAIFRNAVHLEKKYPGIAHWETGEIKDIPDDVKTPETKNDGTFMLVPLVDDLLACRLYRAVNDDGSTTNPNYTCSVCGNDAIEDSIMHEKNGQTMVPLELDGQRVCSACFRNAITTITPNGYVLNSEEANHA